MSNNPHGANDIIWDLSDLFKSPKDKHIQLTINNALENSKTFNKTYKHNIHKLSAKELATAYKTLEDLLTPLYKLTQFASLSYCVDTESESLKQLVAKVDDCEAQVSNNLIFFDLELSKCNKNKQQEWTTNKHLINYKYSIERSFQTAKYNLDEHAETWITIKDVTGINGYQKLYEELTASFKFKITLDGQTKELTGSEIRNLRLHKDPKTRQKAMKLFFNKYKENKIIIGHTFNHILKDYNTERKKRGYTNPIEVRNTTNNLPEKTIDLLHNITTSSNHLVQRYYKIKKKLCNLKQMTLADIYAPLPNVDQTYTYEQAKQIVLEGFKAFDNSFYTIAKDMFDQNRIHAPVLKGKRGGAFCSGYTPDVYPYVMLNFLGKPRDVSTMAHELGHAIHDVLASKQTLTNYHPILPLAETASVFCEMIVTDLMKKKLTDNQTKIVLLSEKLEDIFATSHRQNMFSQFEKETHAKITDTLLSTDDICGIYKKQLETMFGDSVKITPEYHWEWSAIPHFLSSPFYVYAYNFGNLLVIALYQQYLKEGTSFVPKLKKLLAAGSVDSPLIITKQAGVNIQSETFWQQSIDYIEGMINELEDLVHS